MKVARLLCFALAVCAAGSTAALADTFSFSFSGTTFSGSGTLTGTLQLPGEYLITGVTGTTTTGSKQTIAGIETPGTFPTLGNGGLTPPNDNLLFALAGGSFDFDQNGLAYALTNGAQIDLFGADFEFLDRANGVSTVNQFATITIADTTVAATPEPGSLMLLGTGLLGAMGLVRRRSRLN